MDDRRTVAFKLLLACTLCVGAIVGLVLAVQAFI